VNVSVTGTVTAPVVEVLDKSSAQVTTNNTPAIDLGSVVVSTSTTPYTFTINNTGTASLTGLVVATTSAGFTVSAPSATTIPVGGSATFTVTALLPATAGTITGKINITSNAPAFVVNVSATATTTPTATVSIPGITNGSTTPIDLGTVVENTSTAPKTITINNTGSLPLTINSIDSDNPVFAIGGLTFPATIPAGGSATFTIVGTPTTTGAVTGNIQIVSNDPNSPFKFKVKTTGKSAPTGGSLQVINNANNNEILVSNNDAILIGQNAAGLNVALYKITLKNDGIAPLTITNLVASSGFSSTALSPSGPIAPGASAVIMVSGTVPTNSAADRLGSITIVSDDASSPFILNLKVRLGTPTGVATALSTGAIDVYPNPTLGSSYLEFNGNFDDVNVVVYSVDGNIVMSQKLMSVGIAETAKLDKIDELAAGIYLVEVTTKQGKLVKRLIKQ